MNSELKELDNNLQQVKEKIGEFSEKNKDKETAGVLSSIFGALNTLTEKTKNLLYRDQQEERNGVLKRAREADPQPCYFCKGGEKEARANIPNSPSNNLPCFLVGDVFIFLCGNCLNKFQQLNKLELLQF